MPAACCGGENIQGRSQLVAPGGAGRRPEAVLTDLATTYRPATTCRPAGAARRPGGALALLEIVTSFTDCYRSGPEHRQEDPLSSEDLAAARRYIAEERKIRRDDHLVYPLGYEMPTAIELTERAVLIRRGGCPPSPEGPTDTPRLPGDGANNVHVLAEARKRG